MIVRLSRPAGWTEENRGLFQESMRSIVAAHAPRNDQELYRYLGHVHGLWVEPAPFKFIADTYFQRVPRMFVGIVPNVTEHQA